MPRNRKRTETLHVVGFLKSDKDGVSVVRRDGGTIVVTANDVGWGERSRAIANTIVDLWNKALQEELE